MLLHDREAIVALAETTEDCSLKWLKTNPVLRIMAEIISSHPHFKK